jgi:uncharacterized 2Fe-2S/4Fe-4S cluster protein (DUF4445 family)
MGDLICDGSRRPLSEGATIFDAADALATAVPSSCRRTGRCRECVVEIIQGAESLSERSATEAFLPTGFRLACQATVERTDRDVTFAVLRRRLRILGPSELEPGSPPELDPLVTRQDGVVSYDGEPVDTAWGQLLGLALDIGTTTVVFELVDLESGRTRFAGAFENPQRFGGSDVMTRIAYDAMRPGELRRALRRALNRELAAAYRELGIDRHEVYEVLVVGNPTMRDLFFGLDIGPLGRFPFRSVTESDHDDGDAQRTGLVALAHEIGLLVHPVARVVGAPLIACHVGADAAADLVATDFAVHPGVNMVIDIGTNTEIVTSDGRRVLAASSPAGPAFEGGGVTCGMAGADGAIERVAWQDGRFHWQTISDAPPAGICGSGLVDLLAAARRSSALLPDGTFRAGVRSIELVPDAGIELSRADVSALAQAKSANAAGQQILLRRLGVAPAQLDRVFLAGAFANSLDIDNAIAIGLLAPVAPDRVRRVGNAAIRGARRLLLSRQRRLALEGLVARIEHVELEAEADFFELFVEGFRFEPMAPAHPVR